MTGTMTMGSGRGNGLRPFVWGGAAGLLLLPAVAMRFFPDAGVDWSAMDFVVMGALLAVACGLYELGARLERGESALDGRVADGVRDRAGVELGHLLVGRAAAAAPGLAEAEVLADRHGRLLRHSRSR